MPTFYPGEREEGTYHDDIIRPEHIRRWFSLTGNDRRAGSLRRPVADRSVGAARMAGRQATLSAHLARSVLDLDQPRAVRRCGRDRLAGTSPPHHPPLSPL